MALFVFVHGGGDSGATFDLVSHELRARGHDAVAPDLPIEDPELGLEDYAATVAAAADGRDDVVLVGHSLGGFTATLAADRIRPRALVLVSAMIPAPGEAASAWWASTGYDRVEAADDPFYADVPPELAAQATARERDQTDKAMDEPFPLAAWPDVPTRFVLLRDDRFFPADFMRPLVRRRLGIEPDEVVGGHMAMLSQPAALADQLASYAD